MGGHAVARVIQRWCRRVVIDADVAGHSTRRGAATDAANLGANLKAIQDLGGWRSVSIPMRYIQDSDAVRKHALADA